MNMTSTIYFTDLALQYFPQSTKRSATAQLKRWVNDPDLQGRLQELHYKPRQRILTPLQHEAVTDFLGKPE